MGILSWLVVGLVAGWLAGLIVRGRGYGCLGDIIAGVLGGLIGGYLASLLFHIADPVNGINLPSILIAAAGAILLSLVLRLLRRR
ncbi:MAG: GlsB/YeaQ/YmgE family stress response membrane protein [Anaerolineae bacterium]